MIYYIGADFGNGYTKVYNNDFEEKYFSGAKRDVISHDDSFIMNGTSYSMNEEMEFEEDKLASDRMYICSLYGMAKYLEAIKADASDVHKFRIGVGMPIEKFNKDTKAEYEKYYERCVTERCCVNGREYKIRIDFCICMAQGMAMFAGNKNVYVSDKRYTTLNFIDIGSGTIDIVTIKLKSGNIAGVKKESIEFGASRCIRDIQDSLASIGIRLAVDEIENAIEVDDIFIKDSDKVMGIIRNKVGEFASEVLSGIKNRNIEIKFPCVMGGAGSDMINDLISDEVNIIENQGQYCNARGYFHSIRKVVKKP